MAQDDQLGIYLSVPFCRAKCSFCNFSSGVGTPEALERYVGRLCAEIHASAAMAESLGAELPRIADTVYLGGGTPSLLHHEQLRRIFAALRERFTIPADAEITLEAAPGQIAPELLDQAQALGVNRVSLGVQSFMDRECTAVGRLHTGAECAREIRRLRAAGLREVGADLIAGLPYQNAASWAESLRIARGLAADGALTHLSVYMLEVDEDSRLGREVLSSGLRLHAPHVPPDELAAELYEQACTELADRTGPGGFAQYEISNFAAQDAARGDTTHRCRHNRKYWQRAPYLGFGLDAHSMLAGGAALRAEGVAAVRFSNADELVPYHASQRGELVRVGPREAFEETVFLNLRMVEGLDLASLRAQFPAAWITTLEDSARELVAEGFLDICGATWSLTARGRMLSNDVFARLLLAVPA